MKPRIPLAGFLPILRREIRANLTSPLFYVSVGVVLLIISSLFLFLVWQFMIFSSPMGQQTAPPDFERNTTKFILTNTFYMIHFFLMFVIPVLSMRLIAEERKSGTLELLVTNPVDDWGLLLGKYFGALSVIGLMLILTLPFPLSVELLGGEPEWPVVISCFLGLVYGVGGVFGAGAICVVSDRIAGHRGGHRLHRTFHDLHLRRFALRSPQRHFAPTRQRNLHRKTLCSLHDWLHPHRRRYLFPRLYRVVLVSLRAGPRYAKMEDLRKS